MPAGMGRFPMIERLFERFLLAKRPSDTVLSVTNVTTFFEAQFELSS